MASPKWNLSEDRYFDPDTSTRSVARELYESVADMPIVSPHGHVDPRLFADEDSSFGTPTDLFIIPDHYVSRMLYSQGIALEDLGIPRTDGGKVEPDHRKIWQIFADNFHLFRGTPSGAWLAHELNIIFGIEEKLTGKTAQEIYDKIEAKLAEPEFRPRALFDRFNIEVLCTTDAAADPLTHHRAIRDSGWKGDIRPTFRPDNVVNLFTRGWNENIDALSKAGGITVDSYSSFIRALEERRGFFKSLGAMATDHAAETAYTCRLSDSDADAVFQRALKGKATAEDARIFTSHMVMESARMSIEDGLVMQFHVGSVRNHNDAIYNKFGPDKGCDFPQKSEFTHNLRAILNKYGNDTRLTLIVFTLDETSYAREASEE